MRKRRKQSRSPAGSGVNTPARGAILAFLRDAGRPRALKHIAAALDVTGAREQEALQNRLGAMVRDGELIENRRQGYGLVKKMDLIPGRVIGHADGFGFLVPDEDGDDLYIPAQEMRLLLHGDRAVVRVSGSDRQGRRAGAVVEVLERANQRVVGRFFQEGNVGFVVPDNRRIHQDVLIPAPDRAAARSGQFVVAEIVTQPSRHMQPVGRITEVVGEYSSPGMSSEIAMRAFDIPHEWPEAATREAAGFSVDAPMPLRGRRDLRDLAFVTIDGEDARDFDDAVYCERHSGGWRLLVAIADVSHYVQPGAALDEEARARGNSVYFPDRVVPMLPEVLSNELCSLKPDVDRLSLVCEMEITHKGKVRSASFHEAVIRSAARMTYTETAAIVVDRDAAARRSRGAIVEALDRLYELYGILHRRRRRVGLLDFDTTESRVEFDADGRIRAIREVIRNDAHRLIEEFMLAANVSTAGFLLDNDMPALYRNHATPKEDKLENLREFLGGLGLELGGGSTPVTADYARLAEAVRDRPDRHLIQTLMLRSLPLAVYSEKNGGHFGLAFEAYTHFTSPIRRYPDLIVHRAIRRLLRQRSPYPYESADLHRVGEHCSMTERRADEATRDAVQRLKCQYMEDKVGEVFAGTITGVTGFGLFVELDDIFTEGLVHVTSLPNDYYHFDPIHHQLQGERRGMKFRLANRVSVRVLRVNVDDKKVDFELEDAADAPGADKPRRGKRRHARRKR